MILGRLRDWAFGTLRRQLTLGIAILVASVILLFVQDITRREQSAAVAQQSRQAQALAQSVAKASAVWLASRDVAGLQEIIDGLQGYPDLSHAIVLDNQGQVLAHSDTQRRGQYLSDLPQQAQTTLLQQTPNLVDVASPVMLGGQPIGWARIGLGGKALAAQISAVRRQGLEYALLAVALSVLFAALAGSLLSRRLNAIEQVANAIQDGDTSRRASLRGNDEAARLGRQFNAMLDWIAADRQALADSETRFKSIIAVSNTGAWVFHQDTQYLWCSPEYFTMLGYEPAAFITDGRPNLQQNWGDLLHPEDAERSARAFADYLQNGSVGMYESQFRMRHANGDWVWIWSRGQTLRTTDGSLSNLTMGTHINVTEQKLAEQHLDKARQMAESIARTQLQFIVQKDRSTAFDGLLHDLLALVDSEYAFIGEVLYDAGGLPYLHSCTSASAPGQSRLDPAHPTQAASRNILLAQAMRAKQAVIMNSPQAAFRSALGIPVYRGEDMLGLLGLFNRQGGYDQSIIDYLHPLTATIGQLISAMRSQIKQQEAELRLNSISNNLPSSMVYQIDFGEDGSTRQFTYLSAGVEHLHGITRADALRNAALLYQQIHPDDRQRLQDQEAACMHEMSEFHAEYRSLGPDGKERWYSLSSTPSRNANNHLVWDGIEIDITERKEADRQLQELNLTLETRVAERTAELTRTLEHLKQAQQELIQSEKLASLGSLVAGVAHELNTPLGNALMVSSTLAEAHGDISQKLVSGLTRSALDEFLSTVHEGAGMLSRNLTRAADLVSSFKQVAVDQSNHQRRQFGLRDILTEVEIIMAPSLRKAHVSLNCSLQENVTLDSFPGALTQALMILISNSITHAFENHDNPQMSISASTPQAGRVQIEVQDNGSGIAQSNLGRIFEPFYTTKLGKGGSGLGLHIFYNVVTGTLGGKVHVASTEGQGTRMLIDIPLTAPHPQTPPATGTAAS